MTSESHLEQAINDVELAQIELPYAVNENRCVSPPIGCGTPIKSFRNQASYLEYRRIGLCQRCQDVAFNDPAGLDPDYILTCDDLPCCDVGVGIYHHPMCGMPVSEMEGPPTPEEEETLPADNKSGEN